MLSEYDISRYTLHSVAREYRRFYILKNRERLLPYHSVKQYIPFLNKLTGENKHIFSEYHPGSCFFLTKEFGFHRFNETLEKVQNIDRIRLTQNAPISIIKKYPNPLWDFSCMHHN